MTGCAVTARIAWVQTITTSRLLYARIKQVDALETLFRVISTLAALRNLKIAKVK